MEELNEKHVSTKQTLLFSYSNESRALALLDYINGFSNELETVMMIRYENIHVSKAVEEKLKKYKLLYIEATSNPYDFLKNLKNIENSFWETGMLFDISCVRVPELFTLLGYIKKNSIMTTVDIAYSIPYDYEFPLEPFTSYRSYLGDLKMHEMLGFSGRETDADENSLFLFMGFEGAMGLKVVEDSTYNNLILVNNLPSFYPKYKDISVINNFQLMERKHRYIYTPADNPFETYNILEKHVNLDECVTIAPLSTKPVALGICLFALEHKNIRVVYPVSSKYNYSSTTDIYKTVIYSVNL